jgi:hypothetical protein
MKNNGKEVSAIYTDNPKLGSKMNLLTAQAEELSVEDQHSYEEAAEFLKSVKALAGEITDTFGPIKDKAHQAHKEACAQEKKFLDPLNQIEARVKQKMTTYYLAEEKKRREEQLRLEAEAKKKQEEEALRNAEHLEAQGHGEEAAAVIQDAIDTVPVVNPTTEQPSAAGVSVRKVFKYRIIKEDDIKREYMMPNDRAISGLVKNMGKRAEAMVGGIQVYEDAIMGASRG